MAEKIEIAPMRWGDNHKVFDNGTPILVFLVDRLDEAWSTVPEDVLGILETMLTTSSGGVRLFEVDPRVEPDFLDLFGVPMGAAVVRRLPGEESFSVLRPKGNAFNFSWVELVEFCRPAFAWHPRFIAAGGRRFLHGVAGEISAPADIVSGEITTPAG